MNRLLKSLVVAALLLALAAQIFILVDTYGPRTAEIYKAMGQTGSWRGANFAFSQEAANFYAFLNSKIPTTSVVVVQAGTNNPEPFSRKGYVEFFLWPRAIRYCYGEYDECIQEFGGGDYSILITNLQGLSISDNLDRLEAFNTNWGVFLPSTAAPVKSQSHYESVQEIIGAALLPVLLLSALTLPGTIIAKFSLPKENILMHIALGIGVGLGWLSFTLFVALWIGYVISTQLVLSLIFIYWIVSGTIIFFIRVKGRKRANKPISVQPLFIVAVLLIPVVWAAVLAVGNAYSHTDEIVLWGAKGYGIPAVGLQQGVTERGTLTTQYPLNIPLLISSFLVLFGERLPESKLIFPVYFFGLISLAFVFLQRHTTAWASVLGSLLIATIPFIFSLAFMAHANLPSTFYLVGGCLLLHQARQTREAASTYWLWGVIFLGLAAWSRPEGIYLAWAIGAASVWFYRRDLGKEKKKIILLITGLGLYSFFWFFAARYAYFKSGFTSGIFSTALSQVLQGNLHFSEAFFILQTMAQELFNMIEWGATGWVLVASTVVLLISQSLRGHDFSLVGFGAVIILAVFAGYLANSYGAFPGMDIGGWLETGLMRLALPGLLLIWLQFMAATARHFFPLYERRANETD